MCKTVQIVAKVAQSGRLWCVLLGHEKSKTITCPTRSGSQIPTEVSHGEAGHRELCAYREKVLANHFPIATH